MDRPGREPSFDRRTLSRRTVLRRAGAASTLATSAFAGCAGAPAAPDGSGATTDPTPSSGSDGSASTDASVFAPVALATEAVADGFTAPLGMEAPAGVDDRLYVVDQGGTITAVDGEGPDGELYVCTVGEDSGSVLRIVDA